MQLSNLKITISSDRKLMSVECDDFRIKLNGKSNEHYVKLLGTLGLQVVITSPDTSELLSSHGLKTFVASDGGTAVVTS